MFLMPLLFPLFYFIENSIVIASSINYSVTYVNHFTLFFFFYLMFEVLYTCKLILSAVMEIFEKKEGER